MSTLSPDNSAGKTIAVILGAQAWPYMEGLKPSDAFSLSARSFKAYLQDKDGLNLPKEHILDLFDEEYSNNKIDEEVATFLRKHQTNGAPNFKSLIIYYTGHGAFTRREQHFQMILRSTHTFNSDFSGYQMRQLAATVNLSARTARKVVILDCCYAAAAFSDWQMQSVADVKEKIGKEASEQFAPQPANRRSSRDSGTALICACDDEKWALYKDGSPTMFSGGLLQALREGDPELEEMFGIEELFTLTCSNILQVHQSDAVSPTLHVPKGQPDTILTAPMFPNPARRMDPTAQRLSTLESDASDLLILFERQAMGMHLEGQRVDSRIADIYHKFAFLEEKIIEFEKYSAKSKKDFADSQEIILGLGKESVARLAEVKAEQSRMRSQADQMAAEASKFGSLEAFLIQIKSQFSQVKSDQIELRKRLEQQMQSNTDLELTLKALQDRLIRVESSPRDQGPESTMGADKPKSDRAGDINSQQDFAKQKTTSKSKWAAMEPDDRRRTKIMLFVLALLMSLIVLPIMVEVMFSR